MKIPAKYKYMMPDIGGYSKLFEELEPPKSDPNAPGNPRHPVYGGTNAPPHPPVPKPSPNAPQSPMSSPVAPKMAKPTMPTPPAASSIKTPPTATPDIDKEHQVQKTHNTSIFNKKAKDLTPVEVVALAAAAKLGRSIFGGAYTNEITTGPDPSAMETGNR